MDIAAVSMAMSLNQIRTDVSFALMSKTLEIAEISGDELTKMMEAVATGVGQNIDVIA